MRIALAFVAAAAFSTTGCATDPADGCENDCTVTPPPPPTASGTYQVRSDIDITVEALLPQSAADLVGVFRTFETNPAGTLLDLAEAAGVPALADIRDALPQAVEDKIEGWMNDQITQLTINGTPVTEVVGGVVDIAELALTQFALDSELTITNGVAVHTLTTLDLTPAGLNYQFALDQIPSNVISQTTTSTMTSTTLTIGDHTFGLAYGEYIWEAFEASFVETYGDSIYYTLADAIDCPAIAAAVATKCYQGYCVGHATELRQVCNAAITELVNKAYGEVAALRFDVIHFAAGTATLVDADSNLDAEALSDGVWTAEINASQGLRSVPATFTATR